MHTQTRPPLEIIQELCDFLRQHPGKQMDIAKIVGVHQSTISRVQAVKSRKRISGGLLKLCKYAKITTEIEFTASNPDPSTNHDLMSALKDVWDGTPGHARALARLIRDLNLLSPHRKSR